MKTETKILSVILVFSAFILIASVFLLSQGNKSAQLTSDQVYEIDYSKGQKVGSDSAKVKLVEFSDLQCPACKSVEPAVKQIREKYKDSLLFVYRHFPLPQHAHAQSASNFAEYAATEGKFWEVHDKLFDTQDEWAKLSDPADYFANLGAELGLDKNKVKEAVTKGSYNQIINDDVADGNKFGVDSTPTFFVNGKKINLQMYSDLDQIISSELNK